MFPGGAVIPDWSVITTPNACAALSAVFEAFIGPKWRGIEDVEHRVRRTVLRAYAATGRAPVSAKIAQALCLTATEVASALRGLAGRDLIVLDSFGRLIGAYPFTDGPSEHHVELGGVTVKAMCAIDALGIGAMLERDSVIHSVCRQCQRPLGIRTHNSGRELPQVEPVGIVVWSGHRYADDCAASSLCTLQAFFCDGDHLETWRANSLLARPCGIRLSLPEAWEVGRAIFAPMCKEMRP